VSAVEVDEPGDLASGIVEEEVREVCTVD